MIYREEKLTQFFNEVNKFHLNLKFPCKNSSCTVNILDLNASLRNDAIPTVPFIKPAGGHQYLHYQSSHSLHIKTSIPYSKAIVSRICSSEKDFKTYISFSVNGFSLEAIPK